MVVGAGGKLAVVAQIELRVVRHLRFRRKAQHCRVTCRRGAVDGEGKTWCARKSAGDGPRRVSILVLPAEPQVEVKRACPAKADAAWEIGTERAAQGVGRLCRHVQAQRLRARLGEAVLRHTRALKLREWCQSATRWRIDSDL